MNKRVKDIEGIRGFLLAELFKLNRHSGSSIYSIFKVKDDIVVIYLEDKVHYLPVIILAMDESFNMWKKKIKQVLNIIQLTID